MANILLVDPDEVAQMELNGILARGNHRFAASVSISLLIGFWLGNARSRDPVPNPRAAGTISSLHEARPIEKGRRIRVYDKFSGIKPKGNKTIRRE